MNLDMCSISIINFNFGKRLKEKKEVPGEGKAVVRIAVSYNKIDELKDYSSAIIGQYGITVSLIIRFLIYKIKILIHTPSKQLPY